jgi:hypothetical protein
MIVDVCSAESRGCQPLGESMSGGSYEAMKVDDAPVLRRNIVGP